MGITRKGIFRDLNFCGFAPSGISTRGGYDGGIAWVIGVCLALGKEHGLAIGREGTSAFVEGRVQFRIDGDWFHPFTMLVFLCHEDISCLGTSDATHLIALGLIACGGKIQLVEVLARKHRRILCTSRIKEVFALYGVGGFFLPLGGLLGSLQTVFGELLMDVGGWQRVDGHLKLLGCFFVVAITHV